MIDEGIKRMMHETDSLRIEALSLHQKYDDLVMLKKGTGDLPDRIYEILLRMNENADMIEDYAESVKGKDRKDTLAYVEEIRDFLDENVIIEEDDREIKDNKHRCKECGREFTGDSMFCSRKCESSYYDLNDEDS